MKLLKLLLLTLLLSQTLHTNDDRPPIPYNFLAKKEVKNFVNMMVNKYHFKRSYITSVMKHAKLDRDTLARYTGKYKVGSTNGSWERYKAHVLDKSSLAKAKKFKKKYYKTLKHGYARGREPVRYVQRIRDYHNILLQRLNSH